MEIAKPGQAPSNSELARRLFSRITKTENGCWLWGGCKNSGGYGALEVQGKMIYAHRLSYMLKNEPLGRRELVLHSCDTPACINPDHLHTGTYSDNMKECHQRGRNHTNYQYGEKSRLAKLSEKDVIEIRSSTEPNKNIAKKFNIHIVHVGAIKRRLCWKHIP